MIDDCCIGFCLPTHSIQTMLHVQREHTNEFKKVNEEEAEKLATTTTISNVEKVSIIDAISSSLGIVYGPKHPKLFNFKFI